MLRDRGLGEVRGLRLRVGFSLGGVEAGLVKGFFFFWVVDEVEGF